MFCDQNSRDSPKTLIMNTAFRGDVAAEATTASGSAREHVEMSKQMKYTLGLPFYASRTNQRKIQTFKGLT